MSTFEFFAHVVKCYVENDVSTIGFSDNNEKPENYVIITRLDEDDLEPDDAVGIQTSLSGQEYTRSISKIDLKRENIEIYLNKDGMEKIGFKKIIIRFDEKNANIGQLIEYINNIFDDTNVILSVP